MSHRVIFSDLDGTLLDGQTYSYHEALNAIRQVIKARVPLVFCSSKTRAEQEYYREALGIADPFIVENGAAIYIPRGTFDFEFSFQRALPGYSLIELGGPVTAIRQALAEIRRDLALNFRAFSEMPLLAVCQITGLSLHEARLAVMREYSETIRGDLPPQALDRLRAALAGRGLICISGGKFHDVTYARSDKGRAAALLADLFRRKLGEIVTIGLGDSPNDASLLAAVDRPYLVQKPGGGWETLDLPGLTRVEGVGPLGWSRAITEILDLAPAAGQSSRRRGAGAG